MGKIKLLKLYTVGDLAKALGVEKHHAEYIIRKMGVEPVGRAGGYRLFDLKAQRAIGKGLEKVKARRQKRSEAWMRKKLRLAQRRRNRLLG